MTLDIQRLRDLLAQASPCPFTLATSNSWRRIVDAYHREICSPCNQSDGHVDLRFPNGGPDGPDAKLLIAAVNALPGLLDHVEEQAAEVARLLAAVQQAYGYLWHVNSEPGTPNRHCPEAMSYKARKVMRDLLTNEQRGEGINSARTALSGESNG